MAVRQAMIGQSFKAPSGFTEVMQSNHHLTKPVMVGEIQANGQFTVVWKTKGTVRAQPWSPYIPGNESKPDRVSSVLPLDFGTETATAGGVNPVNR